MQAASSICTVRRQFSQAQWTLVKVFRYKNSSFDLTYHFDCLLDNSLTNSPGIHQATMFFFVGPQGQYLMWFTGPYRFLLASGQRASVSVEPWTQMLDKGNSVDAVYLDFRKAFDTVAHKNILVQLKGYGVNGQVLSWIKAFLPDKRQKVYSQPISIRLGNCDKWYPTRECPRTTAIHNFH